MARSRGSPGAGGGTSILVLLTVIRLLVVAVTSANAAPGSAALVLPDDAAPKPDLGSFSSSSSSDPAFLAKAFATTFSDGEQRLTIIGGENIPTDPVCRGQPTIMTRSATMPPNGACLPSQTAQNLSCTCLQGFSDATAWEFQLIAPSTGKTSFPTSQTQADPLEVNSMMLFSVPGNVTAIKLWGTVDTPPIPMKIVNTIPGDATVSLVRTENGTAMTSVEVANVDFSGVAIGAGFVPTSVTNLTMRNCKLTNVSNAFLHSLAGLEALDLSSNSLTSIYSDVTEFMCTNTACPLEELNLANNSFTAFPALLHSFDRLKKLDLRGNKIKNYTVCADTFKAIARIEEFSMDQPTDSYECTKGEWRTVHGSTFCVTTRSMSSAVETPAPTADTGTSYLIYVVIAGALLIAALLFLTIRKAREHPAQPGGPVSSKETEELDSMFDNTLSFGDSSIAWTMEQLNDPIILIHRIPYDEIRVATCLSKGGFGIVYSGIFQRRRVAIKRIRVDLGCNVALIHQFIKEISLMATLHHPRVVEFIGVAWDSLRNISAVTEFMDRGDLRAVLRGFKLRNCQLTWENHKTRIALHIAEALTYLHSLSPKVIHRDLKSKNVLLNSDLDAKLSDFGISRERNIEETHMTAGIGTSFWIAPEVLLGKDYDEHADIFSFGVVLSEIDTDDYPYWNEDNGAGDKAQERAILTQVASGTVRPTFTDDCPKGILDLADSCLQVNPENRPSAAEVVYALQQLVRNSFWSSSLEDSVDSEESDRITHAAEIYI
ncbi:Tkl protein kinase, partial [Globisporangium splendens]